MARKAKGWLAVLFVCCLLTNAALCAAEDSDESKTEKAIEGASWEELTAEFLAEREIESDHIGIGYRNIVTGEEHYLNGGTFFVGASLYKVPLNMYFSEKIYNGEMTEEDTIGGTKYSVIREESIVNSDNNMAALLWMSFGTYRAYREAIAPYVGENPETADEQYYGKLNNYFTPREMIYCLNLLQTQSERFPGVLDAMLRAEPTNYFNYHKQDVPVAQKYGYLKVYASYNINSAAVVYTDEPFALVVFTISVSQPEKVLADYCSLMIDYTQYCAEQNHLASEGKNSEIPESVIASPVSPSPCIETGRKQARYK